MYLSLTNTQAERGLRIIEMSLPALPLPLASLVLEIAVGDFTRKLIPDARERPDSCLKNVAQVNKSWCQLAQQLIKQFDQETLEIQVIQGVP